MSKNIPQHIRLSELAAIVGQVLDNRFGQSAYWVLAEVSGHQYKQQKDYHSFDLIEKKQEDDGLLAKFSAKAWGAGAAKLSAFERKTGQRFSSNIQVLIQVKVVFHQQYGLALDVVDIDSAYTVGKLYEARHLTLLKLVQENDFIQKTATGFQTRNKSIPLPRVIQRLAIISSLTSAGMEDFIHTLEKNPDGYQFEMDKYLTVVQGVDNSDQIVVQLIDIFKSGKNYDAVLLLRGGGAQTDFLLFDHYQIARAIAKFPIPVITGIGHQKNETLSDLMAHTATKTPTQAAEFILHHNRQFEKQLLDWRQSILLHARTYLSEANKSLSAVNSRVLHRTRDLLNRHDKTLYQAQLQITRSSRAFIYRQQVHLQQLSSGISKASVVRFHKEREALERKAERVRTWAEVGLRSADVSLKHLETRIRLMSPEKILEKGYALIRVGDGLIEDAETLQPGQKIDIVTSKVTLNTTINKIKKHTDGTGFNL